MTLLEVIDRNRRHSVRIAGVPGYEDARYAFLSGPDQHGSLQGCVLNAVKFKCQNIPGGGIPVGRYSDPAGKTRTRKRKIRALI